ncbi:MAG: SDR family NAD(P)-dependent oxidoreductase, partial [Kiloniellales bacterium]|nr:SDR family NAD(P)-dependent oxidoreductase [Kiloniellales bacterium]
MARRFGAGGFRLGLISRKAEGLNALVAELDSAGHEATGETADAGDPQSLGAALEALQARLGSAAVLIYNAALLRPGGPLELSPDRLAEEFGVNVQGALVAAQ